MKELFELTDMGGIFMKNRFLRAATWEAMAEEDGTINNRILKVYEDLAKGGAAAIITGYAYVIKEEQPSPKMIGAYDDRFIENLKPLTKTVHDNGSRIILQLAYGGSFTWFNVGEREIWGPSAVLNKISQLTPKKMTIDDIKRLVKGFGESAERAMKSGFDGVEIHGGHGYLLNQFLSPNFNRREDEYGGNSENRARIIYEIFDSVREHTSPDFPVLIKINCSDFMGDKGLLFKECKTICKKLADKKITAIEISGGPVFRVPKTEKEPTKEVVLSSEESYFSEYAKDIAESVDVPVILVGGNRSPEIMEEILNNSEIEYFSMSRPLLSEPDLVNKWKADKTVRPRCISCGKCFGEDGNMCIFDRKKEA